MSVGRASLQVCWTVQGHSGLALRGAFGLKLPPLLPETAKSSTSHSDARSGVCEKEEGEAEWPVEGPSYGSDTCMLLARH